MSLFHSNPSSLRRSLGLTTLGGCFYMVYAAGIGSPVTTDYFRELGATEFHFGLLGGIPMILLTMQFVGALIVNRLRHRKPLFMISLIGCRLLYLPVAFLPLLCPRLPAPILLAILIGVLSVSNALWQLGSPVCSSWMADLIPHRILNTYWGTRQMWMNLTGVAASLAVAWFAFLMGVPATTLFPILTAVAVTVGVIDILLFFWVDEPLQQPPPPAPWFRAIIEPLKDAQYRRFLFYQCAWLASTMCAAAFMQLYLLKIIGLTYWQTTLIWATPALGMAISSRGWGRIADRHGHRPVLIFCTYFKSLVVIAFLLVTPSTAMWMMPLLLLFDGAWNAGNVVATNGYIMKLTPRENRTMFIASFTGLAGLAGGLSAVVAGWYLDRLTGFSVDFLGRIWNNYHVLFLASLFLRIGCAGMVHWIREPDSAKTVEILDELMDVWPMNILRFPVDLYRRHIR